MLRACVLTRLIFGAGADAAGAPADACGADGWHCDSAEASLLQTARVHADADGFLGLPEKVALCNELRGGILDSLATSFYSNQEVGEIACNMAANIYIDGVVIAAPANGTEVIYEYPNGIEILQNDYLFMWQRDAGLTMRTLMKIATYGKQVKKQVFKYANTINKLYSEAEPNNDCWPHAEPGGDGWCSIFGEPKFFVNGSVYDKGWGRAQNDGPAINAMVLMDMLDFYDDVGKGEAINAKRNIIGALNYVGQLISDSTVDPWEELYGQHFFDQAIMQLSFLRGERMAKEKGWDKDTGNWPNFASMMQIMVHSHWNESAGAMRETLARPWYNLVCPKCLSSGIVGSSTDGPCELDVATLLGALYGYDASFKGYPELVKPWDSQLLATADLVIESMAPTYQVNQVDDEAGIPGLLIGRYPGDEYTGVIMSAGAEPVCSGFNCGNPWFVATHGMAEVMYTAAGAAGREELQGDGLNDKFLIRAGKLAGLSDQNAKKLTWKPIGKACYEKLKDALIKAGDSLLIRAKHHAGPGLHMSEQIYRGNDKMPPLTVGQMVGVEDLTWSYASVLDALHARSEAMAAGPA